MGRTTTVGKTFPLSAFRENATRKMEYWDADPLQTPPTIACAFTQTPGIHKSSCPVYIRDVSIARAISGHRLQPELVGAPPTGEDTPNCGEVSASSALTCVWLN